MSRLQVLQMVLQVLQLAVTMMLLTVELRRLFANSGAGRNLDGARAEPPAPAGHHMLIPLFISAAPAAALAALARAHTPPWTVPSPTSSPPIVLAASR